jgi:hypothetical protein
VCLGGPTELTLSLDAPLDSSQTSRVRSRVAQGTWPFKGIGFLEETSVDYEHGVQSFLDIVKRNGLARDSRTRMTAPLTFDASDAEVHAGQAAEPAMGFRSCHSRSSLHGFLIAAPGRVKRSDDQRGEASRSTAFGFSTDGAKYGSTDFTWPTPAQPGRRGATRRIAPRPRPSATAPRHSGRRPPCLRCGARRGRRSRRRG